MTLPVDAQRISRELEKLSAFSDTPWPSVTRIVFSRQDVAARSWLKQQFESAGLTVREDPIGNTFARWQGSESGCVATGSHIDAIPNAGRFDGTVGVLGALEALRALRISGFEPRRSIEVVLFTSEEPTRFGLGCLGSRMLAGVLGVDAAQRLRGKNGETLDEVREFAGFAGPLETVALQRGCYGAFVELHIEQGPLLESADVDIGIVTRIAAPASFRVTVEGSGGHAGAVLMRQRRDAFVGAAEMAIAVESCALSTGAEDSVATTGVCDVFPGAVNSVPSRARLEIDVRDTELVRRDGMVNSIRERCQTIAGARNLTVSIEILNADAPAECAREVRQTIAKTAAEAGVTSMEMVSRAYHDSLFMSELVPTGMIFVPCRNGYSHRPDEFSSAEQIAKGVKVLAGTLARLAS
jgi:N-carbamoyl-L-amino-acid hydrolase